MQRGQWAMQGPGVNRLGREKLHWSWVREDPGSKPRGPEGQRLSPTPTPTPPGPENGAQLGKRWSRAPRGPAGRGAGGGGRGPAAARPPSTHTPFFQGAWPQHPKMRQEQLPAPRGRRSAGQHRAGSRPQGPLEPRAPSPGRPRSGPAAPAAPRTGPGRARGRQLAGPGALACTAPRAQPLSQPEPPLPPPPPPARPFLRAPARDTGERAPPRSAREAGLLSLLWGPLFCFCLPMQFRSAWSCWTVAHNL
ncbi:unnamed protein product [Nyctereutes procyonoides]|uniref:(raccoon dog) hypothetical protein n=1 Tax=Nyctereutes procyonoides TaxID=34880 RepID=A0A811Z760_NYCPR|nr:unnamed protein product [Nyctereutes procyonoides]